MNPEGLISGIIVSNFSGDGRTIVRIRETKIRLIMEMGLEECRKELDWLLKGLVDNCPEEDYLPMFLPIRPDYAKKLARRAEMAKKSILPPSYKMDLNKYFPLPVRQSPVPQHPEIPSYSLSPPCTNLESSEDGQTESNFLEAQTNKRQEEQLKTSLDKPKELHLEVQQTATVDVDGVSHVDCTRSPDQGRKLFSPANVGTESETTKVTARHFVKL